MPGELVPEEYSKRTETIGDYPVTITSYRLGSTYDAKAEVPVPGAGARIASTEESTRAAAEEKVFAEARRLLGAKS